MIKKSTFLIKETNYTKSGKYRNNRIWNSINNAEKSLKHSLRIMKKQDDYIHIHKDLTKENLYYSELEFKDNTELFNKIQEQIKRDIYSYENKELFEKEKIIKEMINDKKKLYNQLKEIYNNKGKEFKELKKLNSEISEKFDNLKETFNNKPMYIRRIYYNKYKTSLLEQFIIENINLLIELNNIIQTIHKRNKIDNIKKDIEKYKNLKNEIKNNIDKLNSEYKITKDTIKSTNDNIKTDINKKKLYKDFSNTKQALKKKNILELVEEEVNNGNFDNKQILHNIRYKHKITTIKAKDKRTLKTIQNYLNLLPKIKEKKEKKVYNNQTLTKEILFKIPEHQLLNIDKNDFLNIVKKFKNEYFKDYKLFLSAVCSPPQTPYYSNQNNSDKIISGEEHEKE